MFGDEILGHPQPQSPRRQHPQEKHREVSQSRSRAEILEECATKLALRLGDGIEDVSFREFVDLILAVSRNNVANEANRFEVSERFVFLVEKDVALENRRSSVLRKVYFSALNELHKIEDPPAAETPPVTFTKDENNEQTSPTESIEDKNIDGFFDRPPPMDPISRASSTTKSSSTASSWSSVSEFGVSSFHFVSQFDETDDDTLNDDYDGSSSDEGSSSDDKSMVVFVEEEVEMRDWCKWSHRERGTASPGKNDRESTEFSHDFQVITVVDSSNNRNRTYSVTTTASSGTRRSNSGRSHGRSSMRRSSRDHGASRNQRAIDAETTATAESMEATVKLMDKPAVVKENERSRSSGAAPVTLSSKFRKMITRRSKSTGTF